jgi:hypothetical protein
MATEAERELQHIPGVLRAPPFGEFIAPRGVELGPTQIIGIVGSVHLGDGSIGPLDLIA